MMTKYCKLILLLFVFVIMSCSNDVIEQRNASFLFENAQSEVDVNCLKSKFSYALARVLNDSKDARELIKKEAIKQFDFDYDVLYMLVKDKQLNIGGTIEELMLNYIDENDLQILYKEIPTLTIFVPNLPENIFSAEKWNTTIEIPYVAYKNSQNKIEYVKSSGEINVLSENEIPAFPIVVVKPSERVQLLSASTRNSSDFYIMRAQNGMQFVFEYNDFNNIVQQEPKTRAVEIPDNLKAIFDAKKYADQNGVWQRDYVYYNIFTKTGIGAFKKNISECIYSFELVGTPNDVYAKISDQDDDPKYHEKIQVPSTNHSRNDISPVFWYNGNYEFVVKLYVSSTQLVSNEIIKVLSISPQSLFDLDCKAGNRRGDPTLVVGVKSFKKYYLPKPLPLFDWNIEFFSSSIKISIEEKDIETTEQTVVETTSTFATNFEFDAGFGDKVKVGAKYGTSSTVQNRVSTTITRYLNSDELGDVIINFGDDIIIKDELIDLSKPSRIDPDKTRLNGGGDRPIIDTREYRPVLNPKYNSGRYKIEVIPLAIY